MRRAAVHAALGEPGRLAIVDALLLGEASPTELQQLLAMPSNLLAHHVRALEKVGVLTRHRSEADRRRTYLTLAPAPSTRCARPRCTTRSGWCSSAPTTPRAPSSPPRCGTTPARSRRPRPARTRAGRAPRRHRRGPATPRPAGSVPPRHVDDVLRPDDDGPVITVCDAAHEELARSGRDRPGGCTGPSPTPPAPARTRVRPGRHRSHRPHRPGRSRRAPHRPSTRHRRTPCRLTTAAPTCRSTSSSR